MRVEDKYLLGTVREIAEQLARSICDKDEVLPKRLGNFQEMDLVYASDYSDLENDNLETIRLNSSGWYGIKELKDIGFSSDDYDLLVNYYGGGSGSYIQLYEGELFEDAVSDIIKAIIHSMEMDIGTIIETDMILAELINRD